MKWYIGVYEQSGIMARCWVEKGYRAMCVDINCTPGLRDGVVYVRADMRCWIPPRFVVEQGVAFFAAFPPCTDLAVSGARWFQGKGLGKLAEAIELFERAAFWAEWFGAPYLIENPVSTMSSYWRKPDHIFHPWQYCGHAAEDCYTKKTCLWTGHGFVMPGKFHPTNVKPDDRIHKASPSDSRAMFRGITPAGFAKAVFLANQTVGGYKDARVEK
ncbi:MAG: hypothetical protein V3R83_12355 [Gammaproteobacteria bacterium]